MADPTPTIRVNVDSCNPGQFFAGCGLLELADRLWGGAEGWFERDCGEFCIEPLADANCSLEHLLEAVLDADLTPLRLGEPTVSPLVIGGCIDLRFDWWNDDAGGGGELKTWAGQQKVVSIAAAMRGAVRRAMAWAGKPDRQLPRDLLQYPEVIPDVEDPRKAVAPFYFDARRAAGALNLDIGFSPDVQKIDATSFPAVEFFCLVGLQRFRPARDPDTRRYLFNAWQGQLLPSVAAAAVAGFPGDFAGRRFGFRLLCRTKYLKGFLPATLWRCDRD
jgi:CRISPR-associated protein Csb3